MQTDKATRSLSSEPHRCSIGRPKPLLRLSEALTTRGSHCTHVSFSTHAKRKDHHSHSRRLRVAQPALQYFAYTRPINFLKRTAPHSFFSLRNSKKTGSSERPFRQRTVRPISHGSYKCVIHAIGSRNSQHSEC